MSDRKLKPDVFSHANLVMWLMLQSPEERYPWCIPSSCMIFQWVRSIDPDASWLESDYLRTTFRYVVKGAVVDLTHFKDIAVKGDNTFGAALKRAGGKP